jgi:hypothetical protein
LSGYLTTTAAAATYLAQTTAASTYLTQTSAASTYLTQTSAASTYLTQTGAASTYQTSAGMSNYLTTSAAASGYQGRVWVGAQVAADGTITYSTGQSAFTVSHPSTGNYTLTFTTAAPSIPSLVIVQVRSSPGFTSFSGLTTTAVQIQTYNTSASATDKAFTIMVFV